MKTKLLAIVLSILCLVQPVAALGMVGVESANETVVDAGALEQADLAAVDYSSNPAILLAEDFSNGFTAGQGYSYVKSGLSTAATINNQASDYTLSPATLNGESVLKVAGASSKWNMTGIKLFTLPITGAGSYELTIDYYLESGEYDNYGTWDVSLGWAQTAFSNVLATGEWKTVTLPFTVTVNASDSSTYDVLPYSPLGVAGTLHTAQTSIPTFAPSVTTKAAYGEFCYYVDNIIWKKLSKATVTYVDKNGTTLKTVSANEGDVITLASAAELGIDYIPAYTIGGAPYMKSTYTVTGDVTVVVGESNILLYDDFESAAADFNTANNPSFAINNGGLNTYFGNGDVGAGTITTVDGNKVMLVSDTLGKWNNIGIRFFNLPIVNVGKYVLSFKANRQRSELFPGITQWNGYNMTLSNGVQYNNFTAVNDEEWVTYTETFEVIDTNGTKSITWTTDTGTTSTLPYSDAGFTDHFYMVANGAETATDGKVTVGTTMQWYLDDIALTFEAPKAPSNISFEDESGEKFNYTTTALMTYTLPTAEALGLAYAPEYTIDGKTYLPGETVSVKSGTDVTFTVRETNIIFKATGSDSADYAAGEAANGVVSAATTTYNNDSVYNASYSGWGANLIASELTLGSYGTYTFDYDVINKDADVEFAVHTMLYDSTSHGDAKTSISGTVCKTGTTHITHTVAIYEKDGAPYFNDREGTPHPLDTTGYFGTARAVAMGPNPSSASGTFYVDNFTISFVPYAPETVEMASYRVENENNLGGSAGIRFASYVTDEKKAAATEYGFVVTRKELITTSGVADYAKLHIDGLTADRTDAVSGRNSDNVLVIAGAAFNDSVNRVYTNDGSIFDNGTVSYAGVFETFFTGVIYNIPEGHEADIFVARPYIIVDGVCYYGDCYESSYEEVYAKANS